MKNVFVLVVLSFIFFSCQDNPPATENTGSNESTNQENNGDQKVYKADPRSPFVGIWRVQAAILEAEKYKNRWFDFKSDGTFESGMDGKKTNSGTWSFTLETELIDIDFADHAVNTDEQWRIQRHNDGIIFMGNTPNNPRGNQMRLEKLEERPQ